MARGGVVVPIIADVKGLAKGVGDAESQLNRLGKNVGKVGANLTKKMTLPILALGAGAVAAFNEVDKGLDAVAIGTGATGEALQDLQKTFKNVAKNSTQGMEEVGNVVAELNTRLGLTGTPLEELSTKMLQFARITGVDSTVATQKVTRAMNDAGIAAGDADKFLDMLLLTSQKTGITVDTLADKMTKFGSPMRQLGFSAEETAALLGSFELAGVNTDLVMGALRQSLGRLAKAGEKDLPGALRKGIKAIQDAQTGGEAAALAIELFGSRAGPDMAAAIREGRLSIEDLVAELEGAEGTLDATAEAVEGPQEAIARMKNQVTLIGAEFANVFIPVLERAIPPLMRLLESVGNMSERTKTLIVVFLGILAAIGPVLFIIGKLIAAVGLAVKIFGVAKIAVLALNAALIANPIGLVVIAIAALVAGLIIAYKRSETFRNIVDRLAGTVRDVLIRAFDWAKKTIEDIWPTVQTAWNNIRPILELIGRGVELYVTTYIRVVATVIRTWIAIFREVYNFIKPIAERIGELVRDQIKVRVDAVKTAIDAVKTAFGAVRTTVNDLKDRVKGPLDTIKGIYRPPKGARRLREDGAPRHPRIPPDGRARRPQFVEQHDRREGLHPARLGWGWILPDPVPRGWWHRAASDDRDDRRGRSRGRRPARPDRQHEWRARHDGLQPYRQRGSRHEPGRAVACDCRVDQAVRAAQRASLPGSDRDGIGERAGRPHDADGRDGLQSYRHRSARLTSEPARDHRRGRPRPLLGWRSVLHVRRE
jgi:TP901 family phage tail tape measure protein